MKHYPHIIGRIFNTPLMIDQGKADIIAQGLLQRMGLPVAAEIANLPREQGYWDDAAPYNRFPNVPGALWSDKSSKPYAVTDKGVAVISVVGTLCHTAATAHPPSGMRSYADLRSEIEDAGRDPAIKAILLLFDSPGGEASESVFEITEDLIALRSIKPVWGVLDEAACSAAYLLFSGCGRGLMPALGYAGAAGVFALHFDRSRYDEKQGFTWTYIQAGKYKTDGFETKPISDHFRAKLQDSINQTYDRMTTLIGRGRPALGAGGIRATEADWFRGEDALRLGLVDGVMNFQEALLALSEAVSGGATASLLIPAASASAPGITPQSQAVAAVDLSAQEISMSATTQAAGQSADATSITPTAENAATATGNGGSQPQAAAQPTPDQLAAAARQEASATAAEIARRCQIAGFSHLAADFIAAGKTPDQVSADLQARKAAADAATQVNSTRTNGGGNGQQAQAAIDASGIYARMNNGGRAA